MIVKFAKKCAAFALIFSIKFHRTTKLPLLILLQFSGKSAFRLIQFATKIHRLEANSLKLKKYSRHSLLRLKLFFMQAIFFKDKSASLEDYANILSEVQPSFEIQYEVMQYFIHQGRLDLAKVTAMNVIKMKPHPFLLKRLLEIYRQIGAICFLLGQNQEANHYLGIAGELRKVYSKPRTPTTYRILASDWFVAVGHVATLDYYLKHKRLYSQKDHRIVAVIPENSACSFDLLRKFSGLGITFLNEEDLHLDYNQWAKANRAPQWEELSTSEKETMTDRFWEYEFPDGSVLCYAHAIARIQKEWEQSKKPSLFQLAQSEKKWLRTFLKKLGMPSDAWFVCLHVRETGFHKQWNSIYPSMRDANIKDYYPAMQEIVNAGGWVLRMGDPSMQKVPTMRNVIDYAHSPHRTPLADLLIAASCRFFLGTNSGFATIPAIYGVPCALSNWVPIGWPIWPSQDVMICKLFREKATQRLLSLEEIFEKNLAFLQNWSDLPDDIELVDNSSDDICLLTVEMLSCFGSHKRSLQDIGASEEFHGHYEKLANSYDTYVGSRFAGSFVKKYPEVFHFYGRHTPVQSYPFRDGLADEESPPFQGEIFPLENIPKVIRI